MIQSDAAPASRPRVLFVDDEVPLRSAVSRALGAAGFEVITASDGNEAMALVASTAFDAIVTDLRMPGLGGVALLRAVRERDLEVPVLIMTGSPDVESASAAVHYGASEYLVKPVPLDQLVKHVRKAVAWRALSRDKTELLRLMDSDRPLAGDRAGLEVTLDRALRSLWTAYQPIVQFSTKRLFAYEALLRSDEPSLPHPGAVLDAADRLGRLVDVGRAVRRVAPMPMETTSSGPLLFVNLHASDLTDPDLASPRTPLAAVAPRVVLELTERASLDMIPDVRMRIAALRGLGYRLAIDDLGAGYAGLTSFAHVEPEFVKLDMSLVRGVNKSAIKRKLIRSMTALCKDLGISVVAEGVETPDERDVLVELGCDLLQGYLFARPGKAFPNVTW